MAKAGSSKPAAPPAKGGDKGFKGKGKPDKVIQKTADLIKGNMKAKASGKGKEKAILGEVVGSIKGGCHLAEAIWKWLICQSEDHCRVAFRLRGLPM